MTSATSILRSPKIKSPTGVADVFKMDEHVVKKDLNSSFSWVECPSSPTASTTSSRTADDDDYSISSQMKAVQDKLDWMEKQRIQDKKDYQDQLQKAKAECRKELEAQYAPFLQNKNKKSAMENRVEETSKLIQYLKDSNAKIRQEIEHYRKLIHKLTRENANLESANKAAQDAYDQLENHVSGLVAVQNKLQSNCTIFKEHVTKLKRDYFVRNLHYQSEVKMCHTFELCLAKVLAHVKNQSKNATMIEQTYAMAEEGALQVSEARNAQLAKFGISPNDAIVQEQQQQDASASLFGKVAEAESSKKKKRSSRYDDDSSDDDDSDSDDE